MNENNFEKTQGGLPESQTELVKTLQSIDGTLKRLDALFIKMIEAHNEQIRIEKRLREKCKTLNRHHHPQE